MNPYAAMAGAIIGAAMYQEQKRNAKRSREEQGMTEAMSPWTNRHGQFVQDPSFVGTVGGSAMSLGAAFPTTGMADLNSGNAAVVEDADTEGAGSASAPTSTNWNKAVDEEGRPRSDRAAPSRSYQGMNPYVAEERGFHPQSADNEANSDAGKYPDITEGEGRYRKSWNPWDEAAAAEKDTNRGRRFR